MKYFSVPADFKTGTIDRYDRLNREYTDSAVIETYGNITKGSALESGRSVDMLPEVDYSRLKEYVQYSKERNIGFNYTLNAPHMQNREFSKKGIMEIMNFLETLYEIGIRSLTIALPPLFEIVRAMPHDFELKASVICQVTNVNKAMTYRQMGVERLVADESLNRDFRTLKQMVEAYGDKLEIIVNSICHKNCTYRMFHYNQIAGDSVNVTGEASSGYYHHRCVLRRYETPENILKLTWVRPEDLHFYTDIGLRYFKIQGRNHVIKGDPVRALEAYFKGSYDGDLLELMDLFNPTGKFRTAVDNRCLDGFIEPFVKNGDFCKNNCLRCGYCEKVAKKCIDPSETKRIQNMAADFYREFDEFSRTLTAVTAKWDGEAQAGAGAHVDNSALDFDFNLG